MMHFKKSNYQWSTKFLGSGDAGEEKRIQGTCGSTYYILENIIGVIGVSDVSPKILRNIY